MTSQSGEDNGCQHNSRARAEDVDVDALIALRRRLHTVPELAGQETVTADILTQQLTACGPDEILTGLGGHGLAAVFAGAEGNISPNGEPSPTVVFRAELDALPVTESNTFAHASQNAGASHACGHDGHMAILVGLAHWLADHRPHRGRIVLLIQPAEETGTGARQIMAEPRFQALTPDWFFALHNLPGYQLGQVLVRPGPFAAGSVGARIQLTGQTSHAAYPEQGKSPAQAMSTLITDLVSLPIPLEQSDRLAMVTIVHARLGETSFGTSPGRAEIGATLRSDSDQTLAELKQMTLQTACRIAENHDLDCKVEWIDPFPVTHNDTDAAQLVTTAARNLGLVVAEMAESPFRWSEDFGWYTWQEGKGALFCLGAGRRQQPLHAADYDFPDRLIEPGVKLLIHLASSLACT